MRAAIASSTGLTSGVASVEMGLLRSAGVGVFAHDKLCLPVGFVRPFPAFEVEPALGHEMESAFGHAFAGDGFGLAICNRIDAFAYEIACGSG